MNLQELKEKLIERLSKQCDKNFVHGMVEACFYVFEQSNKENLMPENKSLEVPKKWDSLILENNFKYFENKIESLQKEIEALKSKKDELEPKQERFYYQVYVERKDVVPHGYKYEIIDRKNVFITENVYTESQAVEVCLFLNSLAKGE